MFGPAPSLAPVPFPCSSLLRKCTSSAKRCSSTASASTQASSWIRYRRLTRCEPVSIGILTPRGMQVENSPMEINNRYQPSPLQAYRENAAQGNCCSRRARKHFPRPRLRQPRKAARKHQSISHLIKSAPRYTSARAGALLRGILAVP